MLPFYVLVAVFLLFKMLGLAGLSYFEGWHTSLQAAVAAMLLLTASAHWGTRRRDLIRMVPPVFPRPDWIVTATGLLELAGAVGILIPAVSKAASIGLAMLLVAMFPANVRAAKEKLTIGGRPVPKLFPRTLLQFVFLAAVLLAG
ncbi:DoxX family protein [Paenibacillus sp. VCA1]|uniref:DoxX family protein n=1 Tax=Paenibacillus sp. VCA1 TaxID=3039148 RepID=UPI0028729D39|nr:DoxX family protein [Paenibacillus sp. VCA1]MDR9855030.1 DoxX family protein [Paenibacillus sp. VCA1]